MSGNLATISIFAFQKGPMVSSERALNSIRQNLLFQARALDPPLQVCSCLDERELREKYLEKSWWCIVYSQTSRPCFEPLVKNSTTVSSPPFTKPPRRLQGFHRALQYLQKEPYASWGSIRILSSWWWRTAQFERVACYLAIAITIKESKDEEKRSEVQWATICVCLRRALFCRHFPIVGMFLLLAVRTKAMDTCPWRVTWKSPTETYNSY